MVRRDRSRRSLHRGSDELRRQRRAAGTDHVANGYSFTDAGLDDATRSDEFRRPCRAGDSYGFTDSGFDDATWSGELRRRCRAGDSYSFTDAGVDDATCDELWRAARTDRYSFTDAGFDDATLTLTTVKSATSCR